MAWVGRLALLVVFGVLAAVLWSGTGDTTAATLRTPDSVRSFITAWTEGKLRHQPYDPGSGPDVNGGKGRLVEQNTRWMTEGISPYDHDRPIRIVTAGTARAIDSNLGELKAGDILQPVDVTWDLGNDRTWTYRTELVSRTTQGQTRIVWRPSSIHPALAHGLILSNKRLRPDRAPVLDGADRTVTGRLAASVIGTTGVATHELAETYPGRVEPGDVIGIGGLQHTYDTRLAGTAGLEVDLVQDPRYAPLKPTVRQAFVQPPVPGEPLHLSLDTALQRRADAVVARATSPTAVVAIDALNGNILAAASGGGAKGNLAVQGRYPPGLASRPIAQLATLRKGAPPLQEQVDCTPVEVQGQRFTSPQGTVGSGSTTLSQAYVRGCSPGIVRTVVGLDANDLNGAASTLGIGASDTTGANAFTGVVPATTGPLSNAQNALGEGGTLVSPLALARMAGAIGAGVARPSILVRDTGPNAVEPSATALAPPGAKNPDQTPSPSASTRDDAVAVVGAPAPAQLSAAEQQALSAMMRESAATDPQLAPLRNSGHTSLLALSATAGYGPSAAAPRHGWCVGVEGNLAFAVLVTGSTTNSQRGSQAASVAATFLG